IRAGQRVKVPLGRKSRPTFGYVVGIQAETDRTQVKPVLAIDDSRVLLPPTLMQLAWWMSGYYCCPLGTVIESIIPSAVRKRIGLGYTPMVRLAQPPDMLQTILEKTRAPRRRAVLARFLPVFSGAAHDLAGDS